jgi:hypothetical protein
MTSKDKREIGVVRNIRVLRVTRLLILSVLVFGLAACDAVCSSCGGKGETRCTLCTAGQTDCSICVGGKVGDLPCKFCHAKGTIQCGTCGGKGWNACIQCGGKK